MIAKLYDARTRQGREWLNRKIMLQRARMVFSQYDDNTLLTRWLEEMEVEEASAKHAHKKGYGHAR